MPHEMVITQASDLSVETIGFGEDESLAKRVFHWTANALMREGHILMGNIQNPNFVEVIQRRGPTRMFIELRYRPTVDTQNIFWLIRLLASEAIDGHLLGKGIVRGEIIRIEQQWKNARYHAKQINPNGMVITHALPGERDEAIKAFAKLVQDCQDAGQTVQRNVDALMKYSAMGVNGLTSFEFVEAVQM